MHRTRSAGGEQAQTTIVAVTAEAGNETVVERDVDTVREQDVLTRVLEFAGGPTDPEAEAVVGLQRDLKLLVGLDCGAG